MIRWHGLDALLETATPKEASAVIGQLCESAFLELQARSFERFPQTDFERELGESQRRRFAARHKKVFGPKS